MRTKRRSRSVVDSDAQDATVEERLHGLRDDLLLVASIFESLSVAPDYLRSDLLAAPACRAASNLVAQGARKIRQLLDQLPADVLNHAE